MAAAWGKERQIAIFICLPLALVANDYPWFFSVSKKQQNLLSETRYHDEMTSLESMLAALHSADVKHVFQMPEMPWPEAGPQRDFLDYQHFLPYTLDKPDSVIQWSYGLNPADPVLQDLIHLGAAAENGEPTAPCDLASKGFEAVLVEKTRL